MPLQDSVLLIDDDRDFRGLVAAQLRMNGLDVLSAADYEEGLSLFQQHANVQLVILDHPTNTSRVDPIVHALRALRPELKIVGNSGSNRREEFARAGVPLFLQKPWRFGELEALLEGRTLACVGCSSPLPLRLPHAGERGESWVCACCGACYYAILDEQAAPEARAYVVRSPHRGVTQDSATGTTV